MMASVSSQCAALSSPSILKNCRLALLGLGLGSGLGFKLELGLGSVLVIGLGFGLGLQFRIKTGRKTSSHIFLKDRNSITLHTYINKLSACHICT